MKNSIAGKTAYYGILIALALVLSYIEVLIPLSIGIPGIKIGLANIVVLTALYTMGTKDAFMISCVRIILVGFTFGSMAAILYSMAGGILSWLVMSILKKTKLFSVTGVSIAGGITHNLGQLIAAALVLNTLKLLYYLPILLIAGIIMGLLTGIVGSVILKIKN